MPTCHGQGFIAVTRDRRRFRVIGSPFRRSGHHGWFHDRRSSTAHPNEDGLPVVSTGFLCSSDGFNYLTGSRRYSIPATYIAPACLSPALLRRFRSWWLVIAGVGARWEEEVGPLTSILRLLENGCHATIRTSDMESRESKNVSRYYPKRSENVNQARIVRTPTAKHLADNLRSTP